MKRLLVFISLFAGFTAAMAQNAEVVSAFNYLKFNELDKAKEAIDRAAMDEKTLASAKTWYYRGMIYQAIGESTDANFRNLEPKAFKVAYDSYQRSINYDSKNAYTEDIKTKRFPRLFVSLSHEGVKEYQAKKYLVALENFEAALLINPNDTPLLFNSALAAMGAGLTEKSKEYLNKLIIYKYNDPDIYRRLANILKVEKDTTQALAILEQGRREFPTNNPLMIDELNIYLLRGEANKIVDKLKEATAADPNNKQLYMVLGTAYDNMKNPDEAEKAYKRAVEIDPVYFDAWYNLGAMYYNLGVEDVKYANNLPASKQQEYERVAARAQGHFDKALPYLEKALELSPNDRNTLLSLKEIYARNGEEAKSFDMKKRLEAK